MSMPNEFLQKYCRPRTQLNDEADRSISVGFLYSFRFHHRLLQRSEFGQYGHSFLNLYVGLGHENATCWTFAAGLCYSSLTNTFVIFSLLCCVASFAGSF